MSRNESFSLLVWDYLRSPAKDLFFFCRVSKIGHVRSIGSMVPQNRWLQLYHEKRRHTFSWLVILVIFVLQQLWVKPCQTRTTLRWWVVAAAEHYLEDHPTDRNWLITPVIVSPHKGLGYPVYKWWNNYMVITTMATIRGMILQVVGIPPTHACCKRYSVGIGRRWCEKNVLLKSTEVPWGGAPLP